MRPVEAVFVDGRIGGGVSHGYYEAAYSGMDHAVSRWGLMAAFIACVAAPGVAFDITHAERKRQVLSGEFDLPPTLVWMWTA